MSLVRLLLFILACGASGLGETPKPNFVIILADDLGYGDLASYGSKTIRTPSLDHMAAGGMRFTDFYATAPFCSPSRASLLTGRYPARAGVPYVLFPAEDRGLPQSEVTIAELLREEGYATACIGKWHLGWPERFRAHRHGFHFFYGLPYSNDMYSYRGGEPRRVQHASIELPLMEDDEILEAPVNQHTLTQRYTARAVEFIRANRERPFLLYLPHTFPHTPSYASEKFEGRSPHGLYADTVEEIDWSTGVILATLRELGIDERTLVVFTSDNGPRVSGIGRKGNLFGRRGGGGSAGPLRGNKGSTWDGGMRVPAIFRWPGRIPAGGVTGEVASIADLFPTLAGFAGAPLPAGRPLDGRSLAALLTSEADDLDDRPFHYLFGPQLQAIRLGRWKLFLKVTQYPPAADSLWYKDNRRLFERHHRLQPEPLLYDLESDISESTNVAADHPDIVARLSRLAREFDQNR